MVTGQVAPAVYLQHKLAQRNRQPAHAEPSDQMCELNAATGTGGAAEDPGSTRCSALPRAADVRLGISASGTSRRSCSEDETVKASSFDLMALPNRTVTPTPRAD